jgi:hypothetical protein
MSDTIFRDRYVREVLNGSDCEFPTVRHAQDQMSKYVVLAHTSTWLLTGAYWNQALVGPWSCFCSQFLRDLLNSLGLDL